MQATVRNYEVIDTGPFFLHNRNSWLILHRFTARDVAQPG
jgi:hypothetical protein